MKKIIALLLVLVMLVSVCACKRVPETIGDEEVATAGGESEKTSEEQKEEVQSPAENTNQKQEDTKEQEIVNNTQKQEQTNTTEETKPVEQEQVPTLKYPEYQELNKQLQKEFALEGKGYPTDVYLQEYLPLKLGYVTKKTKDDGTCFYNAEKDFITIEPITEQMIEAAKAHPYNSRGMFNSDNCRLFNSIQAEGFQTFYPEDFDSMLSYIEKRAEDEYIIRGHFEPSYGTSYVYYNVNSKNQTGQNYTIDKYTLYNFVVEKVYTDNCGYKAGDVIEVGIEGTVYQDFYGFYTVTASSGGVNYANFKNATLEQRTFVLSVRPKAKEGKYSDIFRAGTIRQNVYENYDYGSEDKNTLAKEILAKYN